MKVRGAMHVHSTLSHDGKLSLREVADLYRSEGFHFVAMGEHSQDMDADKVATLTEQCAALSSPEFLMMPGVEFTCQGIGSKVFHILGAGCTILTAEIEPVATARHIRQHDGFAVLAHPGRFGWTCDPEILLAVEAVEIWNVGYDGKYAPLPVAWANFRSMQKINPSIMAIAAHDLHKSEGFYDVAVEMHLDKLERGAVLRALHGRAYSIRSAFVRMDADARMSMRAGVVMSLASHNVRELRRARRLLREVW